jgi:transposase
MERRKFTREFKLEAVKLIRDRGVAVTQASHDLGVHQSQLRDWVKKFADDPQHSFPGHGQMKPEQLEIARLRREVTKLKTEPTAAFQCSSQPPTSGCCDGGEVLRHDRAGALVLPRAGPWDGAGFELGDDLGRHLLIQIGELQKNAPPCYRRHMIEEPERTAELSRNCSLEK